MFKCSFDEFVGEKVFSPSYSSAILAPPLEQCSYKYSLFADGLQKVNLCTYALEDNDN